PEGQPLAAEYAQYLLHAEHRKNPDFQLKEEGYDTADHQGGKEGAKREELGAAGWQWRRWRAAREKAWQPLDEHVVPDNPLSIPPEREFPDPAVLDSALGQVDGTPTGPTSPNGVKVIGPADERPVGSLSAAPATPLPPDATGSNPLPAGPAPSFSGNPLANGGLPEGNAAGEGFNGLPTAVPPANANPFGPQQGGVVFDPATMQEPGCVVGFALCSYRGGDGLDHFLAMPGDDVKLTLPTAGTPPRAADASFTIVDFYESKMNEYDSNFVFVPLRRLQEIRGMIDPQSGVGAATAIQIKLKNPADGQKVRDILRESFAEGVYGVYTWRDKQGPLLAAVEMETAILNVLLFMIIAVAGFGILAIFYMIVVEKTRDIGILKSLGASASGVMGVFVGYGISLGAVGAGAGVVLGLAFVHYINEIADVLGWLTGREVFDPTIYYFYEIPAIIDPFTVSWIAAGAVFIAVTASILPARRAALLHPVEALRYE
ncbi:MAG TPA: FtsX-like permease family protein, partial [Pirellulales bacterium]